ncbi:MAG: PAS domain-containing protein [Magnetococcales bacterium]|nr:PAS domain-containing protein [Magnetococcales bacterium]
MNISFRGRLFLATILLMVITDLAVGFYLERGLRTWIQANAVEDLYRNAKAARELLILAGEPFYLERMDELADRFGLAIERRITIIDPDGWVLGDSELTGTDLEWLENHSERPEVQAARLTQYGVAQRFSQTLKASMLYVATTYPHPKGQGVVRIQMSLAQVDEIIEQIRLFLLIAASLGLVVLVVISGVATYMLTRTLRSLALRVNRLTGIESSKSRDEISDLSGSFDRIADDLGVSLTSLARERDRFEAVLQGMVDAVFALDDRGCITLVNQAVLDLFEENKLFIGQRLTEVIGGPEIEQLVDETIRGGRATKQFDLTVDSIQRRLLIRLSALNDGGCVAVLHDISDIHRLEEMRREFVANVSHELRTPVSVILLNSETLMEEGGQSGRNLSLVEALHRHALRLSHTISELLDLSRLDSGAYIPNVQELYLEPEIAHQVESVLLATKTPRAIKLDVARDLKIQGDHHALSRILSNLLSNAVKYTPETARIVVRAYPLDNEMRIEVEDDGPGVVVQDQELIFRRFHRSKTGLARSEGGSGLGLSIVRSYLSIMKGRITFVPVQPHGALFQISLPFSPLHQTID